MKKYFSQVISAGYVINYLCCHITEKYRGSAHWSCNMTKNVSVIFHNLKGYDTHLIMQEIS